MSSGQEHQAEGSAGSDSALPQASRSLGPAQGDVVLAPIRLPLPTKILGVCLWALAWMLLPKGLAANSVIALSCGLWVGSELCRMRRFAYQE